MPCGQPKFSSTPSQPVSSTRARMRCQLSSVQGTIRLTTTARSGQFALDLLDLVQVHLQRPVGDQFDIAEAGHPSAVVADAAIPAADVDDRWILAERLPHHAAPARLECAGHVVGLVGRRRRGEPEWIG